MMNILMSRLYCLFFLFFLSSCNISNFWTKFEFINFDKFTEQEPKKQQNKIKNKKKRDIVVEKDSKISEIDKIIEINETKQKTEQSTTQETKEESNKVIDNVIDNENSIKLIEDNVASKDLKDENHCKIAVVAPITGEYREIGKQISYGALHALTHLDYDTNCEINIYDIHKLDSNWTVNDEVIRFLKNNDKIVIGPLNQESMSKLYNVTSSKKKFISLIDFESDFYNKYDNIIKFSASPNQHIKTIFDYMQSKNQKLISLLLPINNQSYKLQNYASELAKKYNIQIVTTEFYEQQNESSIKNAVNRINRSYENEFFVDNFGNILTEDFKKMKKKKNDLTDSNLQKNKKVLALDVIFIVSSEDDLNKAIGNFKESNLFNKNISFFSNAQIDLISSVYAKTFLEYFYFIGYDYEHIANFNNKYKDIFGYYPNLSIYNIYDIISTLAYLNKLEKFDSVYGLNVYGQFHGILDDFDIKNNGSVSRRQGIYQIENNNIKLIYKNNSFD